MPSNADAIVRQWAAIHGLPSEPARTDSVEGYPHRVWTGPDGTTVIEEYEITGMAHGTPLMPGTDAGQSGEAMAHMLDVGLSSTDRIAAFFGIAPEPQEATITRAPQPARTAAASSSGPANDVQKVIEDALKAAGLMR
jgi:feruloyl esterase